MEKPRIEKMVPVLGVSSYEDAVAHYVDWLGFNLDWEWREAPGQPVIMAISRDDVAFMLDGRRGSSSAAHVTMHVTNLEALAGEWNARRPGSASIEIELPYEFQTLTVTDPSGNALRFHCENSAEQQRLREQNVPRMREYIRERLDRNQAFPTPEEVREAVGPVLGFAIEVLNEFPGYAEVYRTRKERPE